MTLASSNSDPSREGEKSLINKNEIISALKKLVDTYPMDMIPQDVVKETLVKIVGPQNLGPWEGHSAFKKFEQTIAKIKAIYPS